MGKKTTTQFGRDSQTGQFIDRGIAGVTADGVAIRRSRPATHFTSREVDKAVAAVLAARRGDAGKKTQGDKR